MNTRSVVNQMENPLTKEYESSMSTNGMLSNLHIRNANVSCIYFRMNCVQQIFWNINLSKNHIWKKNHSATDDAIQIHLEKFAAKMQQNVHGRIDVLLHASECASCLTTKPDGQPQWYARTARNRMCVVSEH